MKHVIFAFILFLFLNSNADDSDSATVSACLTQHGYSEMQLSRNANGQFETTVQISEKDVLRVLIDTGSNRTLFDLKKIKKLKYELKNVTMKLQTVSGEQEIKTTDIKNIKIGNANTGPMTIYLTDLDYINKQLKNFGNNTVDGVWGNDLLTLYSAIIDIKNSKLYMRVK